MTLAGHRHERIAEEIQHEIVSMLEGELKDPRLATNVIVTEVRVTPDLKNARIYFTVEGTLEERAEAQRALDKANGFIRHELVERLQMRRAPELHFLLDDSVERARRIDELLRKTQEPDAVERQLVNLKSPHHS
ncbi:MAG TPA: 30S ribosome-binding factor RbfA [Candidatus Acidoferrales bacterium]|nr:30S ribosome-binding factor RbfA [Candidatus Acidoferrales bacterium]